MKKIGAIVCLSIMVVVMSGSVALGSSFSIEKSSPEDGSTGQSVDNMGVKIYFSEDVYSEENQKNNESKCILVDKKGKEVPSVVVFNKKEKDMMMVLADTSSKKTKIEGKSKYTLIIDKGFKSAKGNEFEKAEKIKFETLDPKSSMTVSMAMMGIMIVGMIFLTSREAKKQVEEQNKKKEEKVNPYKVAKETGKSVEEIVAKEEKKKEKAAKKERHKKENKVEIANDNKRVSKARPISVSGSTYKTGKSKKNKKEMPQEQKKNQNPNKNKGKRKK